MVASWKKNVARASSHLLESVSKIKIGGGLPVGTFVDLDQEMQLKEWFNTGTNDFENKRDILLEFWSSQCDPSVESIPKTKRLHAGYNDRLQILTLHVDILKEKTTSDAFAKFIKEHDITYPVGMFRERPSTTRTISERFAFNHLPHGVILDGDTYEVKWSGSLFTHNIERVVRGRYGKPTSRRSQRWSTTKEVLKEEREAVTMPEEKLESFHTAPMTCQEDEEDCSDGFCRLPTARRLSPQSSKGFGTSESEAYVMESPKSVKGLLRVYDNEGDAYILDLIAASY